MSIFLDIVHSVVYLGLFTYVMLSDFHPTVSGLAIEDILAYWVLALNLLVLLQVSITGIKYR